MRIATQLKTISVVTICAVVLLTAILVLAFLDFKNAKSDYIFANTVKENFFERATLRDQYFLYRESRVHEQWDKNKAIADQLMARGDTQLHNEEDRQTLQRLHAYIEDTATIFHRIANNSEKLKNAIDNRDIYLELDKRLYSQLLLKANAVRDLSITLEDSSARRVEQTYKRLIVIIGLFTLTLALLTILVNTRLHRLIRKRLISLHDGARMVVGGDLNYRLMVGGADEFSELAHSINSMTDKLNAEISKRKVREEELAEAQLLAKLGSWHVAFGESESLDVWTISKELRKIYGYAEDKIIDFSTGYAVMPPEDQELTQHYWVSAKRGDGPYEWDHRIIVNGEIRWMHVSAKFVFDPQGKALEASGTNQDITERKQLDKLLRDERDFLNGVLDTAKSLVMVIKRDGTVARINHAAQEFTGYTFDEIKSRPFFWEKFLLPEQRSHVQEVFSKTVAGNVVPRYENYWVRKDGSKRLFDWSNSLLFDLDGKIEYLVTVGIDITESKQLEIKLEQQAHEDYLTGLCNRRYFMELAEQELNRAVRYNNPLSIFMMDIDFFKHINDTHGHKAGDKALKKLAEVCRETLREVDIVGRVGGEEFAILLPETDREESIEVAERLRAALAEAKVRQEAGSPAIQFTVSIGVASLASKDDNLDVLLSLADKALYGAKETGRNKVCVAG